MTTSSNDIVVRFVRAFDALKIDYMLVGSFSSNAYGRPRSTKDADFVLQVDRDVVPALSASLGPEIYFESQMSFETITNTYKHVAKVKDSVFKVEIFYLSKDVHDQLRFSRRRLGMLDNVSVHIPTAEDVVITKLRWGKGGSRAKDLEDCQNILAVQKGNLDLDYLRHWCDQHGTREILERLLVEVADI